MASAVLVSAGHVLQWNAEIVKRWSNEIQEAVQSKVGMVQVRADELNADVCPPSAEGRPAGGQLRRTTHACCVSQNTHLCSTADSCSRPSTGSLQCSYPCFCHSCCARLTFSHDAVHVLCAVISSAVDHDLLIPRQLCRHHPVYAAVPRGGAAARAARQRPAGDQQAGDQPRARLRAVAAGAVPAGPLRQPGAAAAGSPAGLLIRI